MVAIARERFQRPNLSFRVGDIAERVFEPASFVQIAPVFVERAMDDTSGCSTSGHVRAVNAHQVLRAAQVGGLPDARLELGVYELLSHLGQSMGPWIGDDVSPAAGPQPKQSSPADAFLRREPRRFFRKSGPAAFPFLELHSLEFDELASDGTAIVDGQSRAGIAEPTQPQHGECCGPVPREWARAAWRRRHGSSRGAGLRRPQ
jgi:hypothetical protein